MNSLRGQNFGATSNQKFCALYVRAGWEVDNLAHREQAGGFCSATGDYVERVLNGAAKPSDVLVREFRFNLEHAGRLGDDTGPLDGIDFTGQRPGS